MPEQLRHLAEAYFHQDYQLEFSGPDDVLIAFRNGEGRAATSALASEIDAVLSSPATESELGNLWVREFGAAYDPVIDGGTTYRTWFAHARDVLLDRA